MNGRKKLSPKLEDYLEAIYRLDREKGAARVRDIASTLSVHKSTVTAAMRSLGEKELVNYSPYELTTLTERGKKVAREIEKRHEVLARFLTEVLSVDGEIAEANACRLEHAIDPEVLEKLLRFIEFVERCPRGGAEWLRSFGRFCEDDRGEDCGRCIRLCLSQYERSASSMPNGEAAPHRPTQTNELSEAT